VLIIIILNNKVDAESLQQKEYKKVIMFPDEEKKTAHFIIRELLK
jgi:hypothetical protein